MFSINHPILGVPNDLTTHFLVILVIQNCDDVKMGS